MFHEEQDVNTGYLEDDEREQRMTTTGTKLKAITLSAVGKSGLRYRPIEEEEEDVTRAPRGYRPRNVRLAPADRTRAPRPMYRDEEEEDAPYMTAARRQAAQMAEPTDEDEQIAPSVRGKGKAQQTKSKNWHPLFFVWLTALFCIAFWFGSTNGAAWYTTTVLDPATYGPTHGNMLSLPLGDGDGPTTPSTLVAMNINGQVTIIKLFPGQPKKNTTFVGPNLVAMGFPDAKTAEINLSSPQALEVDLTIYADQYNSPFNRYCIHILLIGDGKGNLKDPGSVQQ